MITAYHRPQNLDEAPKLISRSSPETVPLGGGTILSQHRGDSIEVVDLQALGLNRIAKRGKDLDVGAAVTLQALVESPECPEDMALALKLEAPLNLRNPATVAGTLVVCAGRSSLMTAVRLPLARSIAFDYVARTPSDRPIVAVAVARWPSGRTRLAIGGWGSMPLLAMDGPDASGNDAAARNAVPD